MRGGCQHGRVPMAFSSCRSAKPPQRGLQMGAAVAEAVGQMRPAFKAQRAHDRLAQGGERLRGGATVHLATVFAKADLTRGVRHVFNGALRPFHDRPVTAAQVCDRFE